METAIPKTAQNNHSLRFYSQVIFRALILFTIANLAFAFWYPMTAIGRISIYNHLLPGRQRLPYGENPDLSHNLSLFNLEAMFASHEISSGVKPIDEYRVILIGDSSIWGFLLPVEHTLASYLNSEGSVLPDGQRMRVYNLGYPVMSLAKDLLILSYALRYEPDLIIWPLTLESFPSDKQLSAPLIQHNPVSMQTLIGAYHLNLDPKSPDFIYPTFLDRTIWGSRRSIADIIRLQLHGVMWAATGIDQDIPDEYTPRMEDLSDDRNFHDLQPPHLDEEDLAFDILAAGVAMAGEIKILFVNEPMFVSHGKNSHIRYNFFYPRWAYDDYRRIMLQKSAAFGWHYFDLWDAAENSEFTNTAVHLTPLGTQQFAHQLTEAIYSLVGKGDHP
jgi:hypothetical protein